jgi:hypothetical protein
MPRILAQNLEGIGRHAANQSRRAKPVDADKVGGQDVADFLNTLESGDKSDPEEFRDEFKVLRPNADVLALWYQCQGFWRYAGMGQCVGLDWQQIQSFFALTGQTAAPDAWAGLRYVESGFVAGLSRS